MSYEHDKKVGKRIKQFRKKSDLSQDCLAAKIQVRGYDNITRSSIAKIEVGQRHISLYELALIRDILGVSFEDLLQDIK